MIINNKEFKIVKEVCVNSLNEALKAVELKADRIELCSELTNGGITPSYGVIKLSKELIENKAKLFVINRPRTGNFVYSKYEKEIIKENTNIILNLNCNGMVIGCLTEDNLIDIDFLKEIITIIKKHKYNNNIELSFHMAFDYILISKKLESIKILNDLGIKRILTRGDISNSALYNINNIKNYIRYVLHNNLCISIMPGGGITSNNCENFINELIKDVELKDKYNLCNIELHGSKLLGNL